MRDRDVTATATPFEKFHSYMRGFQHGAGVRAMDSKFTGNKKVNEFYNAGYAAGCDARREASTRAAAEFGYEPTVFRLAVSDNP